MKETKLFNKQLLHDTFTKARENKSKFVFIHLHTPAGEEVICVPRNSFDKKEKFYDEAYKDNLVHVMNDKVKIMGLSYGDGSELDILF